MEEKIPDPPPPCVHRDGRQIQFRVEGRRTPDALARRCSQTCASSWTRWRASVSWQSSRPAFECGCFRSSPPKGDEYVALTTIHTLLRSSPFDITDSLGNVGLFRCESIRLRELLSAPGHGQFTRRLVGFRMHCGAITGADVCRMSRRWTATRP